MVAFKCSLNCLSRKAVLLLRTISFYIISILVFSVVILWRCFLAQHWKKNFFFWKLEKKNIY